MTYVMRMLTFGKMEPFNALENKAIDIQPFGSLPNGDPLFLCTLTNQQGMQVELINYGAAITKCLVPLESGRQVDVVLGYEKPEDYIKAFQLPHSPYLGAIVGRYAGRIKHGQFECNGQTFQLNCNHGAHHLHGGTISFSKVAWTLHETTEGDHPSIKLQHISPDGEDHYPGTLTTTLTYTLTEQNELKVSILATSSADTIVNITQHSYFNLDGHAGSIVEQELYIEADLMLEVDAENIPTGEFIPLDQHPFNYNTPHSCPLSIDNSFIVKQDPTPQAFLYSKKNKLKMSVSTNQPSIHVYVGGQCNEALGGKEQTKYHPLSGICFEAQNFPDAPNHAHFPSALLRKEEEYNHQTIFKFETIESAFYA